MSGVVSGFNGRNGPVTLQQSDVVDVLPNATVSGAITVNGALSAASADLSGNVTVGGALSGTTADLSGNVTVGGSLNGATADISGNVTVGSALSAATADVSGNATIGGALNVSGALTANGMLVQSFDTSGIPSTVTTTNTTPGATLSAAEMISGSIIRTGPTVAFTDTTDTAANIVASFGPNPPVNASYQFVLINQTSVSDTLAAGSGVTISGSSVIAPENSVTFKVTVTDTTSGSQAVTITRLFSGGT